MVNEYLMAFYGSLTVHRSFCVAMRTKFCNSEIMLSINRKPYCRYLNSKIYDVLHGADQFIGLHRELFLYLLF